MGVSPPIRPAALLLPIFALAAGAQHWGFESYGSEQGLTNGTVMAVAQDQTGFIWLATEGGLFRYDRFRFERIPVELNGKDVAIKAMHLSSDGAFWAAANEGLLRWNGTRMALVPGLGDLRFVRQNALVSDREHLYAATPEGLRAISLRDGKVRVIFSEPVTALAMARDGRIWFGCGDVVCTVTGQAVRKWGTAEGVAELKWEGIQKSGRGGYGFGPRTKYGYWNLEARGSR